MQQRLFYFGGLVAVMSIAVIALFASGAFAQTGLSEITYPVRELGSCGNEDACRAYCEDSAHLNACLDFAEAHNLISGEKLAQARKFEATVGKRPGDCDSEKSCKAFCDDVRRIAECLKFAEDNSFLPPEELEEIRKVEDAVKRGERFPGDCRSKQQCEVYCSSGDAKRMIECIVFAERNGFMSAEELVEVRKVKAALEKGVRPPPCGGKQGCDIFCSKSENADVCLNFAEAAGLIPPEELKMARAFMAAGIPEKLGCTGKACKVFCEQEEHQEKCGAVMAPLFEADPSLLPPEARAQMKEGTDRMREAFAGAPPEVLECLRGAVGAGFVDQIVSGGEVPIGEMMKRGRSIEPKMRGCFEAGFGGPGGEGGFPGGAEAITDCMVAAGFPWPPQGAPTPEMQKQIQVCAQEAGGGFEGERGGFPGKPGEFPGGPGGAPGRGGASFDAIQPCLKENGIAFPFTRPPSPEDQAQIQKCFKAMGERDRAQDLEQRGGPYPGADDRQGFPHGIPEGSLPPGFSPDQFQRLTPAEVQQRIINQQIEQQTQQQIQSQFPSGQVPNGYPPPEGSYPGGQYPSGSYPSGGSPPPEYPSGSYPPPGGSSGTPPPPPPGSFWYRSTPLVGRESPTLLGFFSQIITGLLQ